MSGREIKFKFWDKDENKMLELSEFSSNLRLMTWHGQVYEHGYWQQQLIPLQFTGLLDKNGKEIYSGDILDDQFGKGQLIVVSWLKDEARFAYKRIKEAFDVECYYHINKNDGFCKGEVIGNIYENPELIEKPHHSTEVER